MQNLTILRPQTLNPSAPLFSLLCNHHRCQPTQHRRAASLTPRRPRQNPSLPFLLSSPSPSPSTVTAPSPPLSLRRLTKPPPPSPCPHWPPCSSSSAPRPFFSFPPPYPPFIPNHQIATLPPPNRRRDRLPAPPCHHHHHLSESKFYTSVHQVTPNTDSCSKLLS
nr:protein PAF1 homolog [Arachis hypogaea]